MIALTFWAALLLLLYVYVGYPALVWTWARLRPRPLRRRDWEPSVSILISAHDEASRIAAKIENLLGLDYPLDRLELLVGSDGSLDTTVQQARRYQSSTVRVLAFPTRRGKPAVLNDLARTAHGEVLIMADVRQMFDKAAIRALLRPLGDPEVGAVSGELVFSPCGSTAGVEQGVGAYWRYEKLIRRSESLVDSTVGVTGAIYAVRRGLFEPLPEDTLLDDVLLPLRIARRGYRVVFESGALAFDRAATGPTEEFARKVRTIAGNFQLCTRETWVLDPLQNRLWLQTVSHKVLRLLSPSLLFTIFLANLFLLSHPIHRWTMAVQIAFYGAALGGYVLQHVRRTVFTVPYVFCLLNCATVVAFVRFFAGRQGVLWRKVG